MGKKAKRPIPKTRRARGTGSIFPDKRRGGYRAKVKIGKYPNGATRYTEVWARTQAEVVERMKLAQPPGPQTTVAEWGDRWVKSASVREQTRDLYRESVTLRFNPALGHLRVTEVTAFHVEQAAKDWAKEVGANSVRKHLAHLQSCFAAAERAELVTRNPVKLAKKPPGAKVEIDPFEPAEFEAIVTAAASEPLTYRLAVMAATGCRIGEALAMKPSDFDPVAGMLSITQTLTRQHGHGNPKSSNSARTIRVPRQVRLVFAALGTSYTYTSALRKWNRLLAKLGIRKRGPHHARHTVATQMLAAGIPVGDVAKYLGDTPATIITRYLHPTRADACAAIEGLLGGGNVAGNSGNERK